MRYFFLVLLLSAASAHGQISRVQGPGPVSTGQQSYAVGGYSANRAADTFYDLHVAVIKSRIDAESNLSKCPREAQRHVGVCRRFEQTIATIRNGLATGAIADADIRDYKATSREFEFSSRDYVRALENPPRPYQLPPSTIGYYVR